MDFHQNGTKMKNNTFDTLFWDIQLSNNRHIALAVNHTILSEYIREITGYECEGNHGKFKKYRCPFCGKGFIYVDDFTGSYFTRECNNYGKIYDLKVFLENKSKEKVASELECQGKLLETKFFSKIEPKNQSSFSPLLEDHHFKVGLSFAGEYRDSFISKVANGLAAYFGKNNILYDKFYEEEFSIQDLDNVLLPYYKEGCDLIAAFLCHEYAKRDWCQKEWRNILSHIDKYGNESLILFHFEETELFGFDPKKDGSTLLAVSLEDVNKTINFIVQRYNRIFV